MNIFCFCSKFWKYYSIAVVNSMSTVIPTNCSNTMTLPYKSKPHLRPDNYSNKDKNMDNERKNLWKTENVEAISILKHIIIIITFERKTLVINVFKIENSLKYIQLVNFYRYIPKIRMYFYSNSLTLATTLPSFICLIVWKLGEIYK